MLVLLLQNCFARYFCFKTVCPSFCFKTVLPVILLQNCKFACYFASKPFCPSFCFKTVNLLVICFKTVLPVKFASYFASKPFCPLFCFKTVNLLVILLQNRFARYFASKLCASVSFVARERRLRFRRMERQSRIKSSGGNAYFWGAGVSLVARERRLRFRRMERRSRIKSSGGNAYFWGASVSLVARERRLRFRRKERHSRIKVLCNVLKLYYVYPLPTLKKFSAEPWPYEKECLFYFDWSFVPLFSISVTYLKYLTRSQEPPSTLTAVHF